MHRRGGGFLIKKILAIGGDQRMVHLTSLLAQDGYEVRTLGLHSGDEKNAGIQEADALVFPYPFSAKEGCVPTATGLTVHPGDVLECARPGIPIIAGMGLEPYVLAQEALGKGFRLMTYMMSEPFLVSNAELSAEAAVCEAMQRTEEALMGMKMLVVGYGRFGRALAKRLLALGAEVWIAARRDAQRLLAASDGMHAVSIEDLLKIVSEMRMVLNTVPARVLDTDALKEMKPGTWLLELASAPYGFDREEAKNLGLLCDVLPALPARYAPMSAARAMKLACTRLLLEASL